MLPEHQARGERDDHHGNVVALARAIRRRSRTIAAARMKRDAPSAALVSTKVTPIGLYLSVGLNGQRYGRKLIPENGSSGTSASTNYGQTLDAQLEQLRAAGGKEIRTPGPTSSRSQPEPLRQI